MPPRVYGGFITAISETMIIFSGVYTYITNLYVTGVLNASSILKPDTIIG